MELTRLMRSILSGRYMPGVHGCYITAYTLNDSSAPDEPGGRWASRAVRSEAVVALLSRKICSASDYSRPVPLAESLRRWELEGAITGSLCQLDYLPSPNTPSPCVLRYTLHALLAHV